MTSGDLESIDRRTVVKMLSSASIMALAGCSSDTGNSESEDGWTQTSFPNTTVDPSEITPGGQITYFDSELSPTLDPHKTKGFGTTEMSIPYNRLFSYDQDLNWRHELATDINIPDNTTYVFPLREGVTFHDGSEWNASVAKWNFDRMLSDYADISSNLQSIEEVEASGKMELTLHLSEPFAPFLDNLVSNALFVSRAALEGKENAWMQKHPVGTGPFQFDSWDTQNNVLTYKSFDDYWMSDEADNQLPYLDSWEFRAVPSATTRVQAFKDQGNYLGSVPAQNVSSIRDSKDYELASILGKSNTIEFLSMNTAKAPFDDPLVREAVYYAVDNEGILGFSPRMKKLTGPLPKTNWGSNPDLQAQYDPGQAQSLLEEAGMANGFDFTLKVWNSQPWRRETTTIVQNQLSQVGINAEIEVLETATVLEQVGNGEFEMYNGHWGGGGYLDPYGSLHTLFHSNGQYNHLCNYSNDEIDTLLDEALLTTDKDERQQKYQQVEKLVFEAHPQVWYGTARLLAAHYDEVKNVFPVVPSGYFPRFQKVWIDQQA